MCGRYYIEIDESELEDICRQVQQNTKDEAGQLTFNIKSGEVFPTNIVPIRTGDSEYATMKWGFTAYDGRLLINARSETALDLGEAYFQKIHAGAPLPDSRQRVL